MHRMLWLGSFLDEKTNQIMLSQGYKNAASYVSQRNLLEGLEVESRLVFDSVNAISMAGYPRQGKLFMKPYRYSHKKGATDICVGFFNPLYANKFFMKKAMLRGVKAWIEKRNTGSMMKNKPFLLRPSGKDYLWGGQRLNDDYSKEIKLNPLAETWECSTHPDGPSIVASGTYKGLKLRQVLEIRPDFLGTHPKGLVKDGLPVLIKFIDAKKKLSVQVHPSDKYAFTHENGQLGKSEMWYVIDAEKGAKLVYGCDEGRTR